MENQILEREKMSSECYELYKFLCANNVGEQNAIKQEELSVILDMDRRTIRKCIYELNTYNGDLKVVCTGNSGVWIASSKKHVAISAAIDLKKALTYLKEYNSKMRRNGLDGQLKIQFSRHEKPIREAFVHQEIKQSDSYNSLLHEDEKGQMRLPI
jgi:hypothetical protein